MTNEQRARLAQYRALDRQRRIAGFVWLALGAFLVGMILCAPVMNAPANGTISATAYFGDR